MAFVSRAERKIQPSDTLSVGPGAYLSHTEYQSNLSYAPFSSTSERDISKMFCKDYTPGPGTYNRAEMKALQPGELDHWGQPKFTSPFASSIERFQNSNDKLSPGPGSYQMSDSWQKQKQSGKIISAVNWTRIPSAPSIPAMHQSYGYEQTSNGGLIMQSALETVHSGTKKDCVGPGHYKIHEPKKSIGPKWHKSKSQRTVYPPSTTGPAIGPGTYVKARVKVEPIYKLHESVPFATKTGRSGIPDSNSPGPGYYAVEKFSAFNKKKTPSSLQNFGSSSSRFISGPPKPDQAGPGYYNNLNSSFGRKTSDQAAPFCSSDMRFQYKLNSNPGPGYYENENLAEALSKRNLQTQGVFGSTQKRFFGKDGAGTPGPGHYKPEGNKKKSQGWKPNAVFASKVQRGHIGSKTNNPPPGSYEAKTGFKKQKTNSVCFNPTTGKMVYSGSESNIAFASNTERFFSEVKGKGIDTPGPGAYDYSDVTKTGRVILSTENRFKNKEGPVIPGPGAYFESSEDRWNKKSYNVLFSEII